MLSCLGPMCGLCGLVDFRRLRFLSHARLLMRFVKGSEPVPDSHAVGLNDSLLSTESPCQSAFRRELVSLRDTTVSIDNLRLVSSSATFNPRSVLLKIHGIAASTDLSRIFDKG